MTSLLSRVAGRLARQAELIVCGHILNAPWKDRDARRRVRYKATVSSAMRYLSRYDGAISSATAAVTAVAPEPERAFSIWFQGEENAPDIVKACFRSMRRNLAQPLVVLDETTLFDWISLPEEIISKWKKGKIRPAHFSDICRVELLYQHGGLWLDATDYVVGPLPAVIAEADFFMFMSGSTIRGSYSFVQNCFIRARKAHPLLKIWRDAIINYWMNENSIVNYFTHQLLFRRCVTLNPVAAELFDSMPKIEQDATHTVWDAHREEKYEPGRFGELTKGAFFQKTSYKSKNIDHILPGTIADYMINS